MATVSPERLASYEEWEVQGSFFQGNLAYLQNPNANPNPNPSHGREVDVFQKKSY